MRSGPVSLRGSLRKLYDKCQLLNYETTSGPDTLQVVSPGHPVPPPPRSRARRPLSDEIRDAILNDFVNSGVVPAGERLPTEAELCARYGVSRITVRAALRGLQETGLITVRQGRGSTVLPQSETITSGLDRLCSFETFARDSGRAVDTDELEIVETAADAETADHLDVDVGEPILIVRRVKLYDGVPVGWIVDYVPTAVLDAATVREEFAGSVLDMLLNRADLDVEYSDMDVVPVNLDVDQARRLAVPTGTAALFLDERTCSRAGEVLNWSQAWLLPDHLRFRLRRRRMHGDARG